MAEQEQIEIKLFGLQLEGSGDVRADVFAKKLGSLVKALKAADRQCHGHKTYEYFITDLEYGSAYAAVAERPYSTRQVPQQSSVRTIQTAAARVRDGQGIPKDTHPTIANVLAKLGNGAEKAFSHGEIGIKGQADTVIRVDKFFDKKADRAFADFKSPSNVIGLFAGVAFGTFDGELKEVDLRGTVARAKLILNVGGKEIDCTCNSVSVDNLRDALNQRVTVSALAHYNGLDRLPEQIEIKRIDLLGQVGSLRKWRGRFDLPYPSEVDIW
tara:strand:+ start:13129 stop:13938 length:810 start_codon:yes stop_codon:yes gene_type:complete